MPRKLEKPAYKCDCKDCGRRSGKCPNVYETYSGAYNKEYRCPMKLSHKACATCKHYNMYSKKCELDANIFPTERYCSNWEISKRRQDFINARAGGVKTS